MTTSLSASKKECFTFITLRFGDPSAPSYIRICDASDPQTFKGNNYYPVPKIELEMGEHRGFLDEPETSLKLPLTTGSDSIDTVLAEIASPAPFSPIYFEAASITKTASQDLEDVTYLGEGEVRDTVTNPDRRPDILQFNIYSSKSLLEEIRFGIQLLPDCSNTFGGNGCFVDNSQFFDSSTYYPNQATQIRRAHVELTPTVGNYRSRIFNLALSSTQHPGADIQTLTLQPADWWVGSTLEKDGLSITIRDWESQTTLFVASAIIPSSWVFDASEDNYITLIPGCPKTPQGCRDRNNEINFNGGGWGIPPYNPTIEQDGRG